MAPHSNCLCYSAESAGDGDSEILWDSRFGRGGKVLSADWGREPSGSWMAFRVLDKAHPSPPAGISRLPWSLETLQCYLTHSWSLTWWQAAECTSPEPQASPPSSSRVLTPSTCHDIVLWSGPWGTLLCWQCITVLDLLQLASWFLSHSHQPFWHFDVTHSMLTLCYLSLHSKRMDMNVSMEYHGCPWELGCLLMVQLSHWPEFRA